MTTNQTNTSGGASIGGDVLRVGTSESTMAVVCAPEGFDPVAAGAVLMKD